MSDQPVVAAKFAKPVDVEAGKSYFWCTCGKSTNQPFCNGAHKDTSFTPMKWTAEETKKVFFCQCKHTKGAPFCDGSHKNV